MFGQQRNSNERKTEIASRELTFVANVNIKTPHFSVRYLINTKCWIRKNVYNFELLLRLENMLWFSKGNHRARLKYYGTSGKFKSPVSSMKIKPRVNTDSIKYNWKELFIQLIYIAVVNLSLHTFKLACRLQTVPTRKCPLLNPLIRVHVSQKFTVHRCINRCFAKTLKSTSRNWNNLNHVLQEQKQKQRSSLGMASSEPKAKRRLITRQEKEASPRTSVGSKWPLFSSYLSTLNVTIFKHIHVRSLDGLHSLIFHFS